MSGGIPEKVVQHSGTPTVCINCTEVSIPYCNSYIFIHARRNFLYFAFCCTLRGPRPFSCHYSGHPHTYIVAGQHRVVYQMIPIFFTYECVQPKRAFMTPRELQCRADQLSIAFSACVWKCRLCIHVSQQDHSITQLWFWGVLCDC